MPWPNGMLPIVVPDHFEYGGTWPLTSPGRSMPVFCVKPNRSMYGAKNSPCAASPLPDSFWYAICTVPTFDDTRRMSATDIVTGPCGSASQMRRS